MPRVSAARKQFSSMKCQLSSELSNLDLLQSMAVLISSTVRRAMRCVRIRPSLDTLSQETVFLEAPRVESLAQALSGAVSTR